MGLLDWKIYWWWEFSIVKRKWILIVRNKVTWHPLLNLCTPNFPATTPNKQLTIWSSCFNMVSEVEFLENGGNHVQISRKRWRKDLQRIPFSKTSLDDIRKLSNQQNLEKSSRKLEDSRNRHKSPSTLENPISINNQTEPTIATITKLNLQFSLNTQKSKATVWYHRWILQYIAI